MMYDFDRAGAYEGTENLKARFRPEALRKQGVTSFSAAEMDFSTAPSIREAVKATAERGIYGFTIPTQQYLDAVKWWHKEMRSWDIADEWIVPVLGTIFSVATAIRMTTKEGDGIIVQTPVYYRYEQAATRMKRKTVHNPLKIVDGQYQMDFEDLETKMQAPENKLLVLCNAHNPIGKVWPLEDLRKVAALSAKYQMPVICDEIFGEMTFEGHQAKPYASIDEGQAYAITVTSLGKAFNFTGVNHAHAIIPDAKLRARYEEQKYADHYGSLGPFEYASVLGAYCPEGKAWFTAVRDYIYKNGVWVKEFLREHLPQAYVFPVEGTTVCWIDWSFLGISGKELHDFFEREALFEVETGEVYGEGCERMTRMNLSSSRMQIEEALERVSEACNELTKCFKND